MANTDILQYLRKTPHNTNVNVVKGMIGNESGSGAIEVVTLFDDDISGFTYTPSSQSGPARARLEGTIIPISTVGDGILKVTYEGMHKITVLSGNGYSISFNASELDLNLPFTSFSMYSYYDPVDGSIINMYGRTGQDAELEAYCQESHHLKVEYFTV